MAHARVFFRGLRAYFRELLFCGPCGPYSSNNIMKILPSNFQTFCKYFWGLLALMDIYERHCLFIETGYRLDKYRDKMMFK